MFIGSADNFRMYRNHDNTVHIQGECNEYLNLPEKRIPWGCFCSTFQAYFLLKKNQFKSNKPNESYVQGF